MSLLQVFTTAVQPAQAAPTDAAGSSLGQAVSIQTAVVDPAAGIEPLSARVDVAQGTAATDTGGIGAGSLTSDASGLGLGADVPGYLAAQFSLADRHAPTGEAPNPDPHTDTAEKLNVQAGGIVGAATLASIAKAIPSPADEADGLATVQSLNILPGPPEGLRPTLDLSVLQGHANSKTVAAGSPGAEASADSSVLVLNALAAGLPIDVRVITANASATNHGGATSLAQSCEILVADLLGQNLEPIACDPSSDIHIPSVLRLEFGKVTTTASSTRIVALTVSVLTPLSDTPLTVIELGIAEAAASRSEQPPTQTVCDTAVQDRPTASGSAEGTIARVRDALGLVEADGSTSRVDIDEAGVPAAPDVDGAGSDKGAKARAAALQLEALPQPQASEADAGDVLELNDSHADAPLASDENVTIAGMSISPPPPTNLASLSAATLHSEAAAATFPDNASNLRRPSASATQTVQSLDATIDLSALGGSGVIPIGLIAVQTAAAANRSATGVTADASTNATEFDTSIGTLQISADAIQGQVTASALDAGGNGTTTKTFTIAALTIGSTTIEIPEDTNGDGLPGPSSIDVPNPIGGDPLATVEFGMHITETVGLRSAAIVVDPVVIRVPGGSASPANTVVLGHMEATANAVAPGGAALTVTKQVDVHYDALSFTNGGELAAPHQKIWYRFCVGNGGATTLTNVQLTDVLHADLRAITAPEPDALPAPWTISNQTISRPIGSLAPGAEFRGQVLVEVRFDTPLGVVIPNTATATASGVGPISSNTVSITTGIAAPAPALSAEAISASCNHTTRIRTINARVLNAAGAGEAKGVFIDAITVLQGGHTLVTTLPIQIGDIAAGSSAPFTFQLRAPGAPGTPCAAWKVDVRERGNDVNGRGYAFD